MTEKEFPTKGPHDKIGTRGGGHPGRTVKRAELPDWGPLPPGHRLALNDVGCLELWITDLKTGIEASKPIPVDTEGRELGYRDLVQRFQEDFPAAAGAAGAQPPPLQ